MRERTGLISSGPSRSPSFIIVFLSFILSSCHPLTPDAHALRHSLIIIIGILTACRFALKSRRGVLDTQTYT
jgi:hypothetical protein